MRNNSISQANFYLYLIAEVDDVHSSRSFADGGALLTLPMFYLEGKLMNFVD